MYAVLVEQLVGQIGYCMRPCSITVSVFVEQLVGQIGYCMRPCSISVCCVGGATGRADWLLHETL